MPDYANCLYDHLVPNHDWQEDNFITEIAPSDAVCDCYTSSSLASNQIMNYNCYNYSCFQFFKYYYYFLIYHNTYVNVFVFLLLLLLYIEVSSCSHSIIFSQPNCRLVHIHSGVSSWMFLGWDDLK